MDDEPTYYEQFGPAARRLRKTLDGLRGYSRRLLGREYVILVELDWRLGDEIMASPVYRALQEAHPRAKIHVWSRYPDLLAGDPALDSANDLSIQPDYYYLLKGAPRDAARFDYNRRVCGLDELDAPRFDPDRFASPLEAELPAGSGPLVALAPGGTWDTKRWPTENWRSLADALTKLSARVIVLGGVGEKLNVGTDFCGRTSVADVAALLKHSDAVVSGDSGLLHLALALGRPVVGLYGPTKPEYYVPPGEPLYPVSNDRPCAGCWNEGGVMREPGVCPLGIDPCLGTISADSVLAQVRAVLGMGA